MKELINTAVLVAMLLLVGLALWLSAPSDERHEGRRAQTGLDIHVERTELNGEPAVVDASGQVVAVRSRERVVAASTSATPALWALLEPERVAAIAHWSRENAWDGWRYGSTPSVESASELEALLSLRPDLVLYNSLGHEAAVERLRERGIEAFDLGQMTGLDSYLHQVATLGVLLDVEERAAAYIARLRATRRGVDCHRVEEPASAAYISVYGSRYYGGAAGTTFHDMITIAGLQDAAHEHEGWPEYTVEELMQLDPQYVLTAEGMGRLLCSRSELRSLSACENPSRYVVELDADLLNDSAEGILVAAAQLRDAVYGRCETMRDGASR